MTFTVTTAGTFYTLKDAERLKTLGFMFSRVKDCPEWLKGTEWQRDREADVTIELATIEDLVAFSDVWGEVVVGRGTIEIYDQYRE